MAKGLKLSSITAVALLICAAIVLPTPTANAEVWVSDQVLLSEKVVDSSSELVIMPGVHVKLGPGINITVYGNITAIGTLANPIFFEENSVGTNWGAINLISPARRSHFAHCVIMHATYGIYVYESDMNVTFSNISFNAQDGIHSVNSDIYVKNSSFFRNGPMTPTSEAAIYLSNTDGEINDNWVVDNNNGIFMKDGSTVSVKGNTIRGTYNPTANGIVVRSGSAPVIERNMLYYNYAGIVTNSSQSKIHNNSISDNNDDGILIVGSDTSLLEDNLIRLSGDDGVDMNSGATPRLVNNDIYDNDDNAILAFNAKPTLIGNTVFRNKGGLMVTEGGNATSTGNSYQENDDFGILVEENSGLTSNMDTTKENVLSGLVVDNSTVSVYRLNSSYNGNNVRAENGAHLYLENGSAYHPSVANVNISGAHVVALNFTCDNVYTPMSGDFATHLKMWYLGVKVVKEDLTPFPDAEVRIEPQGWGYNISRTTNANGEVNWWALNESYKVYTPSIITTQHWTPWEVSAIYGTATNSTLVVLNASKNIVLMLKAPIPPNQPPQALKPIEDQFMNEDTDAHGLLNLSEYFSDEGLIAYSFTYEQDTTKIDGEVNGSYLDFFTPTENWNGTLRFQVRATDEAILYTLSNYFNVTVLPVNDPPVLGPAGPFYVQVGATMTYMLKASDVDNPPGQLTFVTDTVLPAIVTLTLDQNTGLITFRAEVEGTYTVFFYVTDSLGSHSAEVAVQFHVGLTNSPPVYLSLPVVEAWVEDLYRYYVSIFDSDGDILTLKLDQGPGNLTLNGTYLSWTPTIPDIGQHTVVLNLTDGKNPPVFQNWTLTVHPKNHPPTAMIQKPAANSKFLDGANIAFSGNGTDQDGDPLKYTWRIDGVVVSQGQSFNTVLGLGPHTISFGVSDGKVTAYANITVTITKKTVNPAFNYTTYVDQWFGWIVVIIITASAAITIAVDIVRDRRRDRMY